MLLENNLQEKSNRVERRERNTLHKAAPYTKTKKVLINYLFSYI